MRAIIMMMMMMMIISDVHWQPLPAGKKKVNNILPHFCCPNIAHASSFQNMRQKKPACCNYSVAKLKSGALLICCHSSSMSSTDSRCRRALVVDRAGRALTRVPLNRESQRTPLLSAMSWAAATAPWA